ncbi:MAG: hypothetical protein ACLP5H_05660 [Desulfomonilaceae bacterium]
MGVLDHLDVLDLEVFYLLLGGALAIVTLADWFKKKRFRYLRMVVCLTAATELVAFILLCWLDIVHQDYTWANGCIVFGVLCIMQGMLPNTVTRGFRHWLYVMWGVVLILLSLWFALGHYVEMDQIRSSPFHV